MRKDSVEDGESTLGDKFVVGGWLVDTRALTITGDGETRHLESRVMDLLVCLASRPGEVLTREELHEAVWGDVVVGYDSLTKGITKLRTAFGDSSRNPAFIETVTKVGYRLVAPVEPSGESPSATNVDRGAPGNSQPRRAEAARLTPRRLSISGAAVLLVAVIGVVWWQSSTPDFEPVSPKAMVLPLPGNPSIAVLPFSNLNGDPEQDYLSEGLSENIISELSRFREIFVIAHNSTMVYRDDPVSIQQVARELGVRYVMEGSLQKADGRVRVTAQLNDAVSGRHIWAQKFDRDLDNLFEIQDEITQAIVASIHENIELAEIHRVHSRPMENLEAYEWFVRGQEQWLTFTEEGTRKATEYFKKALEVDPDHTVSLVGLAFQYLAGYRWGWSDTRSREESLELALETAEKAVAVDPFNHETHWTLGKIYKHANKLKQAEVEYDRAMALNPNDAGLLAESADLLLSTGRAQEAVERVETAMRLNPRHDDWYYWSLGDAQYAVGDCDAAVASFRKMSNPPNVSLDNLAAALVCAGRVEEGRAVVRELLEKEPDFTMKDVGMYGTEEFLERYVRDMAEAGVPE